MKNDVGINQDLVEEKMEEITKYQWLKSHGICVSCGQKDAFPGYVRCPECIEKTGIASAKCWANEEKRNRYNARGRERRKQLITERKEKHLCVICGRPLQARQKEFACKRCRAKKNEKRRTGTTYGEKFRERLEKGICMCCGKRGGPGV